MIATETFPTHSNLAGAVITPCLHTRPVYRLRAPRAGMRPRRGERPPLRARERFRHSNCVVGYGCQCVGSAHQNTIESRPSHPRSRAKKSWQRPQHRQRTHFIANIVTEKIKPVTHHVWHVYFQISAAGRLPKNTPFSWSSADEGGRLCGASTHVQIATNCAKLELR